MPLRDPRTLFGVHQVSPYNRSTGEFYGTAKVIGSSSLSLSGELIKLNGGSQKFPWAIEDGPITAEMSLTVRSYEDWMFELFLGRKPTTNLADTAGAISGFVNVKGTSVKSSTTGVNTVVVIPSTGAANLKAGKYVIKAASATTVDVYVSTDIDFSRGTSGDYVDDLLKITAAPVTITQSANTDIAAFGLRLTGGSGTIGMTTGDTAIFEVRPPSSASMEVTIGQAGAIYPEFGCIVMAQRRGNNEVFEIDLFRCKGIGLPIGLEENAWSEAEINVEAFYDSAKNGIFKIRHISET